MIDRIIYSIGIFANAHWQWLGPTLLIALGVGVLALIYHTSKEELKFAFDIARGPGRLHQMKNILDLGRDIRRQNPGLTDMEALVEARKFSMQGERKN